jgi:hypothetical protein
MELPPEIYVHIIILADDVNITKKLRALSKTSLMSCNIYHKLLLNQKIYINFDSYYWTISNKDTIINNVTKNHSEHFILESLKLLTSNINIDSAFQKIVKYNHEYLDDYFYDGPLYSDTFNEPTAFKMTIREFYNSIS